MKNHFTSMFNFLNVFKKKLETPAIVEGEYLWCIVGNIVDKRTTGEEKEIKHGTKHFRPGAKVYCIPEFGGVAHEIMRVIGQPRKSNKMINIIIRTKNIKNFRLQKVYSPTLFDQISRQSMYRVSNNYALSRENLETISIIISRYTEEIEE